MEYITYGIKVKNVKNGILSDSTIILSEKNSKVLYFIDPMTKTNYKIIMKQIYQFSFDINRGEFKRLKAKSILNENNKNYVNIMYHDKSFDLIFEDSVQLKIFLQAILMLTQSDQLKELDLVQNLKNIWINYDNDFSGKMEYKEFEKFVKELNITLYESKTIEELFRIIDTDKSGFIDFNEFTNYYKNLNSGVEFKKIFNEYTNNNDYMTHLQLHEFLTKEQSEHLTEKEAAEIIKLVKGESNVNKSNRNSIKNNSITEAPELSITLEEFKKLLYDKNFTIVYDIDKTQSYQNMDRPLHHYYINSSHNTYLTGHQFTGDSNVEMYTFCLLQGYRLIELDCWNGNDETGPIITHGYTLCTNILLRDVLHAIKKAAFIMSEFPVILSIENHCKDKQLDIMADYFLKILVDLYVLNPDNVPADYPTLNQLKRKFIIKSKRGRVFRDQAVLKKMSADNIAINMNENKNNILKYNKANTIQVSRIQESNRKKNNNDGVFLDVIKEKRNFIKGKKIRLNDNDRSGVVNEYLNKLLVPDLLIKDENLETESKIKDSIDNKNLYEMDEYKKLSKEKGVISQGKLATTVGMIGTKLDLRNLHANNYQPWDCVTIKEQKLLKYSKNMQEKALLMEYCRGSFFKCYPLRMNSSNLDPVKTWLCGGQIAAINAQSLIDDYTLLNQVFFQMNNNCGYVLKPDKFFKQDVIVYEKPIGKLIIELVSALNLHFILSSKDYSHTNTNMTINSFIIGSLEDEEKNKKFDLKIENNFLNPIFDEQAVFSFEIYETFLSFIYFKINVNGKLRGRCVIPLSTISMGIRIVPIYDNICKEYLESFLVVRITKKIYQ